MDFIGFKKENRSVFCTELAGITVTYRLLTWKEFDVYDRILLLDLVSPGKIEDSIFRDVVLDKDIVNSMYQLPAGIVPAISQLVLYLSGNSLRSLGDGERLNQSLNIARQNLATSASEQMILLIIKAFPQYSIEDLENLEFPEILRLTVMAEEALEVSPFEVGPAKKEKKNDFIERAFDDAKRAGQVDSMPPPAEQRGAPRQRNIQDIIKEDQDGMMTPEQARQQKMIRIMNERRQQ